MAYDGEIDFDPHWRPRHTALRVPGPDPAFTLTLTREADASRWQTRVHIGASGHLYLIKGATGVPFTISGPVDKPKASMPPGIFAGAAIGTAVLPGIGTTIGAGIGGALGRLFKSDTQAPVASAPKQAK